MLEKNKFNAKLELYNNYIFSSDDSSIHVQHKQRFLRLKSAYLLWVEFPMRTDNEIREFLINMHGISEPVSYEDLRLIKGLLCNVRVADKNWQLYRLNFMCEETYEIAKAKKDTRAMASVIDKFGKYHQLHIPAAQSLPWDEIKPQMIEPTDDPRVIGLEYDPDIREKAKALFKKYSSDIAPNILPVYVEDVESIEISPNGDK